MSYFSIENFLPNLFSRRSFMKLAGAAAVVGAAGDLSAEGAASDRIQIAKMAPLGQWLDDEYGLPCYRYTGPLRFDIKLKDGERANFIPDDPVFLLGNYRLNLFVHASGRYHLMTSERAWGRMNRGDDGPYTCMNEAAIEAAGQRHELTGVASKAAAAAEKKFGVGVARYDYRISPALAVTRILSALPSTKPNEGTPAFLVTVRLRNNGNEPLPVTYSESVRVRYEQALAPWAQQGRIVRYKNDVSLDRANGLVRADIRAHVDRPMTLHGAKHMAQFESEPPALFVKAEAASTQVFADKDTAGHDRIGIRAALTISPGSEEVLRFVVGYERDSNAIQPLAARLLQNPPVTPKAGHASAQDTVLGGQFSADWTRVIPEFADETDQNLRREMRWDAAVLEAMAIYREQYGETVVTQGTVYDYEWGWVCGARDLAQHALPMVHNNPALAKSVLRYLMKHTIGDGEIKSMEEGNGWSPHGPMLQSDLQLYFFMLMAEYLRVTGDASVLTESVGYYPAERAASGTGLEHVRDAFLFLRDRVSVGQHGLVRLWNSDWNDMFYHWPTNIPYNSMFQSAESLMNSAMAVSIVGDTASILESVGRKQGIDVAELVSAMRHYREEVRKAFMADWGARPYPRRVYIQGDRAVGDTDIWLEPQGFTLLIPELEEKRKRELFGEIQRRLIAPEVIGARQIESPKSQPATPAGSRENGGFWYALYGPLVLGVATFDRKAAGDLLQRMTFANYAKHFPGYWTGLWTATDSLDSSLVPTEGMSQFDWVYCAHAHAWPLYCYLRLREKN